MTVSSGRVDTLSLQRTIVKDINSAQSRLATSQKQISSGSVASTYSDIGASGKVEQVSSLQAKVVKLSKYKENNEIVQNRIDATDAAIEKIYNIMSDFRKDLTTKRSISGDVLDIKQIAHAKLAQIKDSLNLYFEGRYVFAGTSTDILPVDDIVNQSNIIAQENTAIYYHGDDNDININVSDNMVINYNVRASHNAFVEAIASLHAAIAGQDNHNDDSLFAKSMESVTNSLQEISSLRSQLLTNKNIIRQENESHVVIINYFNENISQSLDTDVTQAVLTSKSNEVMLMAIYQTFARLSQLSFVNYMK
jgi:flagellar hook-associated protein 3 FlgL